MHSVEKHPDSRADHLKKRLSGLLHKTGLLFMALTLAGCFGSRQPAPSVSSSAPVQSQESLTGSGPNLETLPDPLAGGLTLADIPPYSGSPVVEMNGNHPFFEKNEWTVTSFQHYFDLDELGRVTLAYASIGPDMLPEEKRGDISSVKPTGFINHPYPFLDQEYVYNRCHLIAHMLCGQNANPKNLMTGTRYMNVSGMLPYENMVQDYIEETGNHVMYRVTPMFEGDDLVARGVLMEALSIEDQGEGINFCVFAYNVQPGIAIDYATGENWADGSSATGGVTGDNPAGNQTSSAQKYILNTSSKKFHRSDCAGAKRISKKNRKKVTDTRENLIAQGYVPCSQCNP